MASIFANQSRKCCGVGIVKINGPGHQATETNGIGPFHFLVEGFRIIKRYPLIIVIFEVLDRGFFIMNFGNLGIPL
jgi:hypothetical protein